MPLELYLFGMIILGIPAVIIGLVLGTVYGLLRHGIPYLIWRRHRRLSREAEALAPQQAGQQREIVMVDYERLC